jgi:hypothetical protein
MVEIRLVATIATPAANNEALFNYVITNHIEKNPLVVDFLNIIFSVKLHAIIFFSHFNII